MGKTTEKTNRKTSGQAARTKKSAAHASPSGDQAELERSFPDASEIAQLEIARLRNEGLARARELEAFIEAVPDGVAVYDIEGRVVRSNATYRHTLARFIPQRPGGTLRARVKQSPMRDAQGRPLAEEQWPHTRLLRGEVIGGDDAAEVMMYTTDGQALHMSVTGGPLRAADGQIVGAVAVHRDVTAQRALAEERAHALERERRARAEAEIAAAQLRGVLDLAPVGMAVSEAGGRLTQINDAFRALWGEDAPAAGSVAEYHAYKGWWPQTGQPVQPEEWAGSRALLHGETVVGAEVDIETFDGQRKTILDNAAPIGDASGAVHGAVIATVDITERKRAEERLRASEAQLAVELADLQRLQQISSQLIEEGDLNALYAQLLDAALALLHADMGSMQMLDPDRDALRLLAWKGFDPAAAAFWEWVRVESGSSCGVALRQRARVLVPDVESCAFMAGTPDLAFSRLSGIRAVQTTPLLSRSGRLVGMLSTHWRQPHQPAARELRLLDVLARQAADLIERRQAAAALQRAVERFQLAERAASGFVYEWDAASGVVYRSAGLERLLGYRPEEIAPTWAAWAQLVYPGDWQATTDAEERAYLDAVPGDSLTSEYRVRHRDGRYRTVADYALIERDAAGAVVHLVGQTHDITERKRAENQQAFLLELGDTLRSERDPLKIIRAAAEMLGVHLGVSRVGYSETNDDLQTVDVLAEWTDGVQPSAVGRVPIAMFGDELVRTYQAGRLWIVEDAASDPRPFVRAAVDAYIAQGSRALMGTPLVKEGHWVACFYVTQAEARVWTADEIALLQDVAERTWAALERARVEARLRESEDRYRALTELSPQVVFMGRPDGQITFANQYAQTFTGRTLEELQGEGWADCIRPDVREHVFKTWLAATRQVSIYEMEIPFRRADGEYRWHDTRALPITDESGAVAYWIGVALDITERKRAEEALQASERRLRAALEVTPVGIAFVDTQGTATLVNPAVRAIWGEEIHMAETASEYGQYKGWWPQTGKRVAADEWGLARALRTGETQVADEIDIETFDGVRKTILNANAPIHDDDGALVGGVSVIMDITERKTLEAELHASEERYRSIVETANEGVWMVDLEGRTVYLNERMAGLLDYPAAQIHGRPVIDFTFPEDAAGARERIANNLRGKIEQFDFRFRRRDGSAVLVLACTSPVRDAAGKIVGALGMFSDITVRLLLEEHLRASEERFRTLATLAPSIIWTAAPDGEMTYANDQWFAYTGVTPEQNARGWPELVLHPDDVDRCMAAWTYALQTGEDYEIEVRNRRFDGEYRWFLTRATALRDADGRISAWFGVTTDIHERRQLERDVAERASLLEAVFAAAPDRITIFDETGQMVRLNPAALQSAGPERERETMDTVGQNFDLRTVDGAPFPPEELPAARALRGETVVGVEMLMRSATGEQFIVTNSAPFFDITGELRGAVALAHDVTALRRAEREAATWAAQLDATFESLTDGLFLYDDAGQLARMNDAARAILALDAAPDYYSLTPEERTARLQVRDAHDQLLAPDEWGLSGLAQGERLAEPVELRITALDGRTKDLAITGGPVRDPQGKLMGGVALLRDVSERRKLEREAAERASLLQATFDALSEPMCVFDAQGRILRENNAERALFGFDTPPITIEERAARIQLRSVDGALLSPEELPARRVLAGATLVDTEAIETLAREVDGHDHCFSVSGAPIRDDAGQVTGGVMVYHDVTERRRLEQEVEERAGLLEATFDAMTDGVLIAYRDGVVRACNDAYRMMMGYDPVTEEQDISADERRVRFQARDIEGSPFPVESWPLTRILRGEMITHDSADDLYIRTRDGREIVVNATGAPLRDTGGALIGALLVMRDVTAQRALERDSRWQAGMLERAHDAIFLWELDGPILYWNHGAELLYGYTRDEALGQISHKLLHTQRPISPAEFKQALEQDGEWIGELRHTTRDGRRIVVESRHQLLKEPEGRRFVLETCRDITERLELMEALRRSRDELEQRVRERTLDLAAANRSLRRLSRQVLEVQETERRRIARELHDEIGQALTGVKMMIETAQRQNGTKKMEQRRPSPDVSGAIDDALTHVRELSLDLRPAMLDSLGLLPTLLWRFETYTRQTGIQVEFHHSGLDRRLAPEIETGAYRIVQEALTNVARHAAVSEVRIQLVATDEALHIYVVDEGTGFDTDAAIESGLSTGLASMRERATLLGGVFYLSSTPGEGTTIDVELPLPHGDEVERELASDAERAR